MLTLDSLKKVVAKKKKVLGRGEGSRLGKNAGKGHKGQTKRAGKLPVTFEGGRKSIVRRTPKFRGFKQGNKTTQELNTALLAKYFTKGDQISVEALVQKGLIDSKVKKIRVIYKKGPLLEATFTEEPSLYLTKGAKAHTQK